MVAKRKAVAQNAQKLFVSGKADLEEAVVDEAMEPEVGEEHEEEQVTSKKRGASPAVKEEAEPKAKTAAQIEKETVEARTKELKSMYVDKLKELIASYELESGNRGHMIDKIVAYEAKLRKVQREKDAQIRAVVVSKKEELEALSAPAIKKACEDAGIKGNLSKPDRVQELMRLWQEADGVAKALQQVAVDKRHEALSGMDAPALVKMCKKAGLDPYVKDVMVARIIRKEHEAGQFKRPLPEKQVTNVVKQSDDVIDDFLAKEASRKKELELKKQIDEALIKRVTELKNLPVEKLKKLVEKNGLDAGKKEEMIVAMVNLDKQKAAADARRQELKSMSKEVLTNLATSKGLKKSSIDTMVNGLMEVEAKCRAELAAYEAKVDEALSKKKVELEAKTAGELKELCASKGLKVGGGKEERVANLINAAREDNEVHETLEKIAREARKEALLALDKPTLLKLCEENGADPYVPEVMVELVVEHEIEAGEFKEPLAKKARTAK